MKIYLVGGAVRDQLLGIPVVEKDWVVVGATVEDMLQQGFRPVGKDFPVFLHPVTKEEYALARMERKTGLGYTGFVFDTSPAVTLEEDLLRRDLTINAIALDLDTNQLFDPFHGQQDLENRLLRHVSAAFAEDPVRILRVARFEARFKASGFAVSPDTNELMKKMVLAGEVDALVAERVWKELERALSEKNPEQFFQVLADCNALSVLLPQLKINSLGMRALQLSVTKSNDSEIRFATLMHDIPARDIKALCERYRVPSDYRELALLVATHLARYQQAPQLDEGELLALLQSVDAFRREARFEKYLLACDIASTSSSTDWLLKCYSAAKSVDAKKLASMGYVGKEIAEKIAEQRKAAIKEILQHP